MLIEFSESIPSDGTDFAMFSSRYELQNLQEIFPYIREDDRCFLIFYFKKTIND
jgi:hypothetical protein